jgi:hypothetical protein
VAAPIRRLRESLELAASIVQSCKREVWFTAGTLLSGVSRLRAWMAVIWFKEWGVAVSSLRISKLLDIAQSTALNINKKVAIALEAQMDDSAMSH